MKLTKSCRSTSASRKTLRTLALETMCWNSSKSMQPSLFSSAPSCRHVWRTSVVQLTCKASFSASATAVITSQRTPMSMFMMVMAETIMNKYISPRPRYSSVSIIIFSISETESRSVPCRSRLCMAPGTCLKYFSPTAVPTSAVLKAMAKTYRQMPSRIRVKPTDRAALQIAFTIIRSSGKNRMRRAIRNSRVKRSNRAIRRIEASPKMVVPPPEPAIARTTMFMTQVSATIMNTRAKSKANQASLKQLHFLSNAMKRMKSSNEK
mmetsp:Transcript_47295/g.110506  ORF Transcript_47295/g.110506 Transcript_47295/m.110506 type:complete len:265 (-) Transcript_47295:376-1170(-)